MADGRRRAHPADRLAARRRRPLLRHGAPCPSPGEAPTNHLPGSPLPRRSPASAARHSGRRRRTHPARRRAVPAAAAPAASAVGLAEAASAGRRRSGAGPAQTAGHRSRPPRAATATAASRRPAAPALATAAAGDGPRRQPAAAPTPVAAAAVRRLPAAAGGSSSGGAAGRSAACWADPALTARLTTGASADDVQGPHRGVPRPSGVAVASGRAAGGPARPAPWPPRSGPSRCRWPASTRPAAAGNPASRRSRASRGNVVRSWSPRSGSSAVNVGGEDVHARVDQVRRGRGLDEVQDVAELVGLHGAPRDARPGQRERRDGVALARGRRPSRAARSGSRCRRWWRTRARRGGAARRRRTSGRRRGPAAPSRRPS